MLPLTRSRNRSRFFGLAVPQSALDLNFLSGTLDPRITFTRASNGTFFGSNGLLQTAANDVPRFDYDPVTLAARGLLIEEQRTNLLTWSEDFSNAVWTKNNLNVTTNTVVSPDGTTTADKLRELSLTNVQYFLRQDCTFSTGNHTTSVYAKAEERNWLYFELGNTYANVNLLNGTVGDTGQFSTGWTFISAAAVSVGNGWYRCSITSNCTIAGTYSGLKINIASANNTIVYSGTANNGFYVWGAQLEAGAFPTSYIPTTSATATRAADLASMTGTNFSSWYNATEGTLFAQANLISSSYTIGVLIDVGAGGAFGTTEYIAWSGSAWRLAPNSTPINVTSSVTTSSMAKVAAGMKVNDSVISANGLVGITDTNCNIASSPTTLSIGKAGWTAGNYFNGWIQRIVYWPVRVSNSQLQFITA